MEREEHSLGDSRTHGPQFTRRDPDEEFLGGIDETVMPPKSGVKNDLGAFLPWVASYRILLRPGAEIVEAWLLPGVDPADARLRAALTAGGRTVQLASRGDRISCVMVRLEPRPSRIWLHLILLLLTAFTVFAAGALLSGVDPLQTVLFDLLGFSIPVPTEVDWGQMALGWRFALPRLMILGVHEGGHLVAARRHHVAASWPYFIPMPPYLSIIGTLGAFIRLRGPLVRRNTLFDVGVWGPWAGFLIAAGFATAGFAMSTVGFGPVDPATPFVIQFASQPIWLGASGFTWALTHLVGPGLADGPVVLHPFALAGWLGLFLTALNLLPVGQLDGGHVLFSMSPRWQRRAGRITVGALLILGFVWWGWWIWGMAILVLSQGRVTHPQLLQQWIPLSPARRWLGLISIILFFLTFVPVPMAL